MIRKYALLLAAVIVLAIVLAGCGQESTVPDSVAKVDGQPIPGRLYYEYLSQGYGLKVLPDLVDQQVMINLAEKEGVPVTDEQIDQQIEVMKRDGNYEPTISALGSEEALRDRYLGVQARINIAEKLYKSTDKELQAMYDQMKSRFVRPKVKTVTVLATPEEKQFAAAQKSIKNGMNFDEASAKYSDFRFTKSGQQPIYAIAQKGLPEPLVYAANHTKVDKISKPFSFTIPNGPSMRAILKVTGELPKLDLKFRDVKDELRATDALRKSQLTPEPFQKKFEAAKKKAKVEIELPQYRFQVDQIKNPMPMGMPMMPQDQAQPTPAKP